MVANAVGSAHAVKLFLIKIQHLSRDLLENCGPFTYSLSNILKYFFFLGRPFNSRYAIAIKGCTSKRAGSF